MPRPQDPLIVHTLEARAKNNARNDHTGYAVEGNVSVRYYPTCGRYAWFSEDGIITKSRAIDLLTKGLWNPTFMRGGR